MIIVRATGTGYFRSFNLSPTQSAAGAEAVGVAQLVEVVKLLYGTLIP